CGRGPPCQPRSDKRLARNTCSPSDQVPAPFASLDAREGSPPARTVSLSCQCRYGARRRIPRSSVEISSPDARNTLKIRHKAAGYRQTGRRAEQGGESFPLPAPPHAGASCAGRAKHASTRPDQAGRHAMALDEGVELESVRKPLSEAGDILGLWQDDDGSVGLTFASDLKPETWKSIISEAVFEIADELAGGDDKRRGEIMAMILG